jgi:hypothetical protein
MVWLNQILRRQTSRSHYGSKVPAVTVTVFKYRNKIGKNENIKHKKTPVVYKTDKIANLLGHELLRPPRLTLNLTR